MKKREFLSRLIPFVGAFIIVGAVISLRRGDSEPSTPVAEDPLVEAQAPSSLLDFADEYQSRWKLLSGSSRTTTAKPTIRFPILDSWVSLG